MDVARQSPVAIGREHPTAGWTITIRVVRLHSIPLPCTTQQQLVLKTELRHTIKGQALAASNEARAKTSASFCRERRVTTIENQSS